MKYKVGDKVKYDSGDWWFYGTVSAVIENSISPCYRLNVDRMEKKNCKLSITQFEFELEHDNDEGRLSEKSGWENSEASYLAKLQTSLHHASPQTFIPENVKVEASSAPSLEIISKNVEKTPNKQLTEAWLRTLENYTNGVRNSSTYNWMSTVRKQYKSGNLSDTKTNKLKEIDFPFEAKVASKKTDAPKKSAKKKSAKKTKTEKVKTEKVEKTPKPVISEAWYKQYNAFLSGDRSSPVHTWIYQNRKQYKDGSLEESKLNKLIEINFPFETTLKKKSANGNNN